MSKVDTVINKLKKNFEESFSDVELTGNIERVILESPRLNYAFGGGFAIGRMYEFYGPESGGKSTLATYIGAQIQEKFRRPMVVYVDFEYSFDKSYAERLGLKTDKENFIFLRPTSGEDAFDLLKELVKELPVGLIIFDSISATPSKAQVEDTFRATFGGGAKVFAEGLKALNPWLSRKGGSMIMVSQERASMSLYGSDTKTTGGYAPKYYSSWRGRITRIDDIKVKGEKVGIVSKVRATKSKIGIPGREAELHLKFDDGFDSDMEYLTFLVDLGIVEKRGAWFYQEEWGFKGQGKDSVKAFLLDRPEIFEQVKNTVNVMLAGSTVLDKDIELEEEEDIPIRGGTDPEESVE